MKQVAWLLVSTGALFSTLVCGCAPRAPEDTGSAPSAIMNLNSLSPAALDATAAYASALTPAMLASSALDPAQLSAAALAAVQDPGASGTLSRSLLSYTVSCALDSTQSFSFSWVDASNQTHEESYPGLLGLETGWASGALDATGQAWISACLISRVNYFGVPVQLSSRGGNAALVASPDEISVYPNEEGAFWGDVFGDSPVAYACDDVSDDANSRSLDRVCAAGYVDDQGNIEGCGIIQRVGSCDDACAALTGSNGAYHPSCSAGGSSGLTAEVITVFLH